MSQQKSKKTKPNPIDSKELAINLLNETLDVFSKTLKDEIYQKWNSFAFAKKKTEKEEFETQIVKTVNGVGTPAEQEEAFCIVSDKYRRALESFRADCETELKFVNERIFQKYLNNLIYVVDFFREQKLTPSEKAVVTHAKHVLERNTILKKYRTAVAKYVKQEEVRIADIQKYFFKRRLFNTIYDEVALQPTVENFDAAMKEIMSFNTRSYVGQKYLSGMKNTLNKLTYQARDNAIEKGAILDLERLNEIGSLIVDNKGKTLSENYKRVLKQAKKRDKDAGKSNQGKTEQLSLDI